MFRRKMQRKYRITVLVDRIPILDLDPETAIMAQKFGENDAIRIGGGHLGIALNHASLVELQVRRV